MLKSLVIIQSSRRRRPQGAKGRISAMPAFLEVVELQFGSRNLYEVLGVDKNAEEAELRRAYRRLSLRVHPDRAAPEEIETATKKFQTLSKIHSVLTDKDKRAIYDEEGTVDEEDSIFDQERDWTDYWRLLFPKVTVDDIKSFEEKYKGSEEEAEDLKRAYLQHKGDMDHIMNEVLCSGVEDEPHYNGLLQGWIADGVLPDFPGFSRENEKKKRKRKAMYKREAKEAKKMKMESGNSNGDLCALIKARQSSREEKMDSFFDTLEQKYANGSSKKRSGGSSSSRKHRGGKGKGRKRT